MNLPDNAKIWIFQSDREFTSTEKNEIEKELSNFIKNWQAHGADLSADFSLPYNRFIVVGVDENQTLATGCSIDKLTHIIKNFDSKFSLNLLNRMLVSVYEDDTISCLPLNEFKAKLKNQELNADISLFDLSITKFGDYKARFLQPLKDSWATRITFSLN